MAQFLHSSRDRPALPRAPSPLPFADISRIIVPSACPVLDNPPPGRAVPRDRARADRHLTVTARDIQHIGRLAEPGNAAAKRAHEVLAIGNPGAKMRRAVGKVRMMKVVWLDPHRDQTPKKGLQYRRIVIDAAQQDRL